MMKKNQLIENFMQLLKRVYTRCIVAILYSYKLLIRRLLIVKIKESGDLRKVNYGCGEVAQKGYLNIDIRYTKAIDIIADLRWCRSNLKECCTEVYLSHVLEHYRYPGRSMSRRNGTVNYALDCVFNMLTPGGHIRLAVPDFSKLSYLYQNKEMPLYPRISGRICGEQNYSENLHKCVFDRVFLEKCLVDSGFVSIREWDPDEIGLYRDDSFDALNGYRTSLNLVAEKPVF